MVIAAAFLLLLAAAPPAAAPIPPDSGETIVVTATLQSLADALARCKAGGCTPRQDIVASIRYAEGVFRAGRYQEARRVLQQAIGRDRTAAKSDPIGVAALYDATATVAAHDGEQAIVSEATFARARVLHDALPADTPVVFAADLNVADLEFRRGNLGGAAERYQQLARRAEAAHQPTLLAAALLRHATIAHEQHRETLARTMLDQVINNGEVPAAYRLAARATGARFARERGDTGATDALIASMTGAGAPGTPMLLWQPPVPRPGDPADLDYYNRVDPVTKGSDVVTVQWADIGFVIKADGTVDTPEILRASSTQQWAAPILTMIAKRRYAPPGDAADGLYRIERWTLTADYATPVGSLIRRRASNPHFEQLDLTSAAPPSGKAG